MKDLISLIPHFMIQNHHQNLIIQNLINYLQNFMIRQIQMIRHQINCLNQIIPILNLHFINPKQSKLHLKQTF